MAEAKARHRTNSGAQERMAERMAEAQERMKDKFTEVDADDQPEREWA